MPMCGRHLSSRPRSRRPKLLDGCCARSRLPDGPRGTLGPCIRKPPAGHRRLRLCPRSSGLRLEAVVVGGAALALLRVTSRQTPNVDVLAPD